MGYFDQLPYNPMTLIVWSPGTILEVVFSEGQVTKGQILTLITRAWPGGGGV